MSSNNSATFTKDNIDKYFNELSKEYKRLGGRRTPVEIVLIGGAAIIENYGFRNMTTDIDAIIPAVGIMKEAINHIGDKFGLPNGWLNADFMKTSSYTPKLVSFSKPYKSFNQVLNVRIVSGEYLIAMKLKSGRQYKNDMSDIIGILAEHEKNKDPISFDMITKAIEDIYGDWSSVDKKSVSFIKSVLDNGQFGKLYSAIRENEKNIKSMLIETEEKYPGVLDEKNLDYIIESAAKSEDKKSIKATLERLKKEKKARILRNRHFLCRNA